VALLIPGRKGWIFVSGHSVFVQWVCNLHTRIHVIRNTRRAPQYKEHSALRISYMWIIEEYLRILK